MKVSEQQGRASELLLLTFLGSQEGEAANTANNFSIELHISNIVIPVALN